MRSFFIAIAVSSVSHVVAQSSPNVFRASAMLGLNIAQVNGDNFAGYDHFGLHAGIAGHTRFSSKIRLTTEIIYSKDGARDPRKSVLHLHYVHVPIYLEFTDRDRAAVGTGISYGRLFSTAYQVDDIPTPIDSTVSENSDLRWLISGLLHITPSFSASLIYSYSLRSIGFNSDSRFRNQGVFNNTITLRMGFLIPVPKK